jgi:hypothetical protein
MQVMYAVFDGIVSELSIPPPDALVLPWIPWGAFDDLLTPAFWKGQVWQHEHFGTYRNLRLGRTLPEEIAACLLGGYGMKAELGLAAFGRLREHGLLTPNLRAHSRASVGRPLFNARPSASISIPSSKGEVSRSLSCPDRPIC